MNIIGQFGQLLAQSEIPMPDSAKVHEGTYNFPRAASEFAPKVDQLYFVILWVSVVFFVAIIGVMCYFAFKYRRVEGVPSEPSSSHNTALEIFWSVIPSIILVYFFYAGAAGFFESRVATDDAEEIYVTASKWNWVFRYPDGDTSSELHLVRDHPVKLVLESRDVLHSLFIPAFRQKMDIVPGRYTYIYLNPNLHGKFRLACAEYCGEKHSRMRTICEVHKTNEARKTETQWITTEHKYWENGERLYKIHCSGCHNVNGEAATGPALNTIWGTEEMMITDKKIKVDENYIKRSLEDPNADVVAGYGPISKMNTFKGKFSPDDINYIIAFLQYKKDSKNYVEPISEDDKKSEGGDDVKTDDVKTDDVKTDDAKTDDAKTDDANVKKESEETTEDKGVSGDDDKSDDTTSNDSAPPTDGDNKDN